MAQLRQLNVDNEPSNADTSCVKHGISDIKLMLKNLSSQEKLESNQEASFSETVRNSFSLDNMARTENNERQNTTGLSQEAEIGTTVIRENIQILRYQFKGMIHPIHSQKLRETLHSINLKWNNLAGILYSVTLKWNSQTRIL